MDIYEATEQAYKNGYIKGHADAKAEIVHGKWLKGGHDGEYICSKCGMTYCEADPTEKPFNYCPECGSKNE